MKGGRLARSDYEIGGKEFPDRREGISMIQVKVTRREEGAYDVPGVSIGAQSETGQNRWESTRPTQE